MNIQLAKELLGLSLKSSFSLTDAMIAQVGAMAEVTSDSIDLDGRMKDNTRANAIVFHDMVMSAPESDRYGVWNDGKKLFEALVAKKTGLAPETVRKYLGESIKLLKSEGEGLTVAGKLYCIDKPAAPTVDGNRMSASRAALAEKFDGKDDETLKATHDELIKSGELADTQEAALFAKELSDRTTTADKKKAQDQKDIISAYKKTIRDSITDADVSMLPVISCLIKPQGSKQIDWAESVKGAFQEQKFKS